MTLAGWGVIIGLGLIAGLLVTLTAWPEQTVVPMLVLVVLTFALLVAVVVTMAAMGPWPGD